MIRYMMTFDFVLYDQSKLSQWKKIINRIIKHMMSFDFIRTFITDQN